MTTKIRDLDESEMEELELTTDEALGRIGLVDAVFDHAGHVSTVRATYAAIWNHALAQAGLTPAAAPSLERHNATFDPATGLGGLTLWIPLEPA